jgi:hypothetical protein
MILTSLVKQSRKFVRSQLKHQFQREAQERIILTARSEQEFHELFNDEIQELKDKSYGHGYDVTWRFARMIRFFVYLYIIWSISVIVTALLGCFLLLYGLFFQHNRRQI